MKKKFEKNQQLSKALDLLSEKVQFDDENLIIRGIIGSTEAKDRYGDVIIQEGWQLDNFRKNPVILYGHNNSTLPVAKAIEVEVVDKKLTFAIQFATHDFAQEVYKLVRDGFINAFSVGLRILEWKYDEDDDVFVILSADLLELSIVPVPANQEALVERLDKALKTTKALALPRTEEKEETIKDHSHAETCEDCKKYISENFISKEDAEKLISQKIADQIKNFNSQKVADEEGAASPSKSTIVNALEVQTEVKEANKATGKLLKALNQLIKS